MSDKSLEEFYRSATRPTEDCPPSEALAALGHGNIEGDDRRMLLNHVARCADCAEALRIAMAASRELDQSSTGVPSGAVSHSPRRWGRLAAVASVLLVVGVSAWLLGGETLTSTTPSSPQFRGEVAPSAEVAWPQDGDRLSEPPVSLRWPGPTARLELFTDDGISLYRQEEASSPHELPPTVVAGLEAGRAYVWVLEHPSGERRTLRFSLDP